MFDDGQIHYANLENADGVKLGIGSAQEMGIVPEDRSRNTVVLQLEVADVAAFFLDVEKAGGRIVGGPTEDKDAGFSFGSFADPEGNPFWVVDSNCP
jgi:predicted enzyme related to lactoylglutathione lyase